jgi:L-histidine N-alpha-methyltransferase
MGASYSHIKYSEHYENSENPDETFALDVLVGLSELPKKISSKYFYDDAGSRTFQAIMELPEYYLTNCEYNILSHQQNEFAGLVNGEAFNLIELGAGDGRKTSLLLNYFLDSGFDFRYIPIDISEGAMRTLTVALNKKFPNLITEGLIAEYFQGLKWLQTNTHKRNIVLFLGSNLGNFNKTQAKSFLRHMWNTLNDSDFVVIGFDLKKDIDLMLNAYNDAQGLTSDFNLNLLRRINRDLGGNFNLQKFRHYATYDVFSGAIESYLVSQERQEVFIHKIGCSFFFEAWEPIHTEYSYKYLISDIEELALGTGYNIVKNLYDSNRYFVDSIWRVQKAETLPLIARELDGILA